MFRSGILPRIFFAFLILALLGAGAFGAYRLGFAQGYQAAAISAAAAGQGTGNTPNQVAPYAGPWGYAPYAYGPWGFGRGFGFGFFPFFPLFGIGFFLLFLFLIGGLFRGFAHRRWSGSGPQGYWQQEHQRWHEEHKQEEEQK